MKKTQKNNNTEEIKVYNAKEYNIKECWAEENTENICLLPIDDNWKIIHVECPE